MLAGPGHGVARKGFIDGMNCMVLGHTSNHCHSFRIKHLALDIFKGKKKKVGTACILSLDNCMYCAGLHNAKHTP